MYLEFYGLKEKPFALAPDPRFLYLTPPHREALAQLVYGVREGVGFALLTGDVGTGKTTLIHALQTQIDGAATVRFVSHSTLSFDELFEYIVADLGLAPDLASRAHRLLALRTFLAERRRAGRPLLLILDEAHHLAPATLEEIRLLSNFEGPDGKLLQVVLVGQPELHDTLAAPQLRQLTQRIAVRASLRPLTAPEVRRYIVMRLRVAGAGDARLFSDDAARRIAAYTHGVPRLINIVCDHCLLFAYADQRREIGRAAVDEAIRYLEGRAPRASAERTRAARRRWARLAAVLAGLALVTGGAAVSSLDVARLREWLETAQAWLLR